MRRTGEADESSDRPNHPPPTDVSSPVSAIAAPEDAIALRSQSDDVQVGARVRSEFDRMFVDHYERLVRSLTVLAGDREAAADAVQEAFVKAHLRWRRLSSYDDPVGWIRRVAINRLRDDHRRTTRGRRALDRLAGRHRPAAELPEIDEFDRLLAGLPRQQRAVTALFYVEDLGVAEIARTLEISEGSVKSHLHDARRTLRRQLDAPTDQQDPR